MTVRAVAKHVPSGCQTRAPLPVVRIVGVLRRMGGVAQQGEPNLRVVNLALQGRCLASFQVLFCADGVVVRSNKDDLFAGCLSRVAFPASSPTRK